MARMPDSDCTDPSRLRQPPFFIMGCPRSGTTLVSQILDTHGSLAVYQETNYYTLFRPHLHCYGALDRPSNLRRLLADFLESIREQDVQAMRVPDVEEFERMLMAPTFEGVLATMLDLYARQQGKTRGGEKMPGHYAYIPEIVERFPGSATIFVMRDPRDTVLSMQKAFNSRVTLAASSWSQAFEAYTRVASKGHLVRYEELVEHPADVTRRICAFLGEAFEPGMLNFYRQIPESLRALRNKGRLEGPVVTASKGRFREMPADDVARIEAICAAGMEAMGYEFTTAARGGQRMTKEVAERPGIPVRFLLDRLRYYGLNRERWRRGWFRWKLALRLRARYLLMRGLSQDRAWRRFQTPAGAGGVGRVRREARRPRPSDPPG